ncbi:MAG: 23S rRNA (adenine(2030)-N(6))-methyltransferase RlmJ [Treponema sp.]|nr:23S rRNA (adenine(2030)-N(6))-methyltransferase RlmJ [Treponema sp.]
MLSYQHEFHAGNHADLLKHTALVFILESLCKKEKPFTIIDTHAGAGIFSLSDERILKTGEAKAGIEKLRNFTAKTSAPVPEIIKTYLEKEEPYLQKGLYAGSAELEAVYARKQDIIHFSELHKEAAEKLQENMKKRNAKTIIHVQDSYKTLSSLLPPLVKRGLILCDPSYEDKSDYSQAAEALSSAHKKWNTAIIALWYPLLSRKKNETTQMISALESACKIGVNPCEYLNVQLIVKDEAEMQKEDGAHLYGSGMFIMNPPYLLKENLEEAAKFYTKLLVES